MHFDTLYHSQWNGLIEAPVVTDPDNTPNRVLELDRPWKVKVNWQLTTSQPGSYPLDLIDGKWEVKVGVESIGPGDEKYVADVIVNYKDYISSSSTLRKWEHNFTIPVGEITSEGVYQLVTLITFTDPNGNREAMAGFMEGPLITFYQDQ